MCEVSRIQGINLWLADGFKVGLECHSACACYAKTPGWGVGPQS